MPEGEIQLRPEIESLALKLEKDPRSKVFAQLADAYRKSNMLDEAIEIAKKGLDLHPNYAAAHLVLGRCYLEKKIYSLAREEFERVAGLDPHNSVALKLLADVHFALGTKQEAIRRYKQVLEMDPMNVEVNEKLEQFLPSPSPQKPAPRAPEPPRAAPGGEETKAVPEPISPPLATSEASARLSEQVATETSPATFEVVGGRIERKGPLTGDQVSDIVDRMFMDKEGFVPPATPVVAEPIPEAAPSPAEVAPEPVEVLPQPAPAAVQESPMGGEETAEIINGLLSERGLGAPAIPAPEAPMMIERKPAEEAPVMVKEEAPLVAKEEPPAPAPAKGIGATATLAELYEHQGFYDKALELYEQVLAEHPENNEVAERVKGLRSKTYWGEGMEAETPQEPAPMPEDKPSAAEAPSAEFLPEEVPKTEAPREEAHVEEAPVEETLAAPSPEETVPEVLPRVVEEAPSILADKEKEATTLSESPTVAPPLFQPEAVPKPEGVEPGKEIKSFQEWLDSLKKPKA